MRSLLGLVSLALATSLVYPGTLRAQPAIGDEYKIALRHTSETKGDHGSSSSSSGTDAIIERIIAVREDGFELEYDFLKDASAEERAGNWQLPVKIFRPFKGEPQLLNTAELEARVDPWLQKAGWTREACAKWIFTWNAFKIDCDPQSALGIADQFNLLSIATGEGELYPDELATKPEPMKKKGKASYTVLLTVDPAVVRKERADSAVVVAQILGQAKTLEQAVEEQAKEDVSGVIKVRLSANSSGRVVRKERIVEMTTKKADGETEKQISKEIWVSERVR